MLSLFLSSLISLLNPHFTMSHLVLFFLLLFCLIKMKAIVAGLETNLTAQDVLWELSIATQFDSFKIILAGLFRSMEGI